MNCHNIKTDTAALLSTLFDVGGIFGGVIAGLASDYSVNGPYALITTAVSAQLGRHPSIGHNSMALATVTSIIDGTGSVGAAVGPLLAGTIHGIKNTFWMLVIADILALVLLSRLVVNDIKIWREDTRRSQSVNMLND
ncbi:SLC37A1_2 [Lepeophtheirus salmonis]|uniref:SLC37A1_2 n=1 Tax=Lepeophtheirus salmonis TaxID=72036 RepID=A0A7R8D6S9_LEPSM|nr:SLC37A1_2 [Lepeophtheirus salmonis]CAF3043949.1 SLC37A1_2 [Lepeophtheirus salmonis]